MHKQIRFKLRSFFTPLVILMTISSVNAFLPLEFDWMPSQFLANPDIVVVEASDRDRRGNADLEDSDYRSAELVKVLNGKVESLCIEIPVENGSLNGGVLYGIKAGQRYIVSLQKKGKTSDECYFATAAIADAPENRRIVEAWYRVPWTTCREDLDCRLVFDKKVYKRDEPIDGFLAVRNRSSVPLSFPNIRALQNFVSFDITKPDSHLVKPRPSSETATKQAYQSSQRYDISLKPGEILVKRLENINFDARITQNKEILGYVYYPTEQTGNYRARAIAHGFFGDDLIVPEVSFQIE